MDSHGGTSIDILVVLTMLKNTTHGDQVGQCGDGDLGGKLHYQAIVETNLKHDGIGLDCVGHKDLQLGAPNHDDCKDFGRAADKTPEPH